MNPAFFPSYFIILFYASTTSLSLLSLFLSIKYAIGEATNKEENVPKITPSIIAKEKLRMESPPNIKMQSNTNRVLNEVFTVRDRVVFNDELNNSLYPRLGYKFIYSLTRSKITTLSLME